MTLDEHRQRRSLALAASGVTMLILVLTWGAGVATADIAAEYYVDSSENVCVGFGPPLAAKSCEWGTHVTGYDNVALGGGMMPKLTNGEGNVALDSGALADNTGGIDNIASGKNALQSNIEGSFNVATGEEALYSNTEGGSNIADGTFALHSNTTGEANVGLGDGAGSELTTGSNNVDISNGGVAGEGRTTRIGTEGTQTRAFVAGIYGKTPAGSVCDVGVNSEGQLGCGVAGATGPTGPTGSTGAPGPAGSAAIATFASFQGVQSGNCLTYTDVGQGQGSWDQSRCPHETSGFSTSSLLAGPIPSNGATVSSLYATVNGTVNAKDTAAVTVIDNTSGTTLLSCTVTSANKNNCSSKAGESAAALPGDYIEVKVMTTGSSCANKQWRVTFRF